MLLGAALACAGCGRGKGDSITIRGREYLVLQDARLVVAMVEEEIKARGSSLQCQEKPSGACRDFFLERFDDYIRYVNLDPAGNGKLTYSLSALDDDELRENPATAPRKGCAVVYVSVAGFRIDRLECSPP